MKKLTKKTCNSLISSVKYTTIGRMFLYNEAAMQFGIAAACKMEELFRMTDSNMTKAQVVSYICEKYNA